MPSFDVVSEVKMNEVTNAVDQASRELTTRFDFKGTKASFELEGDKITMRAPTDFQLQQMLDILTAKLARRQVDVRSLKVDTAQVNVGDAHQLITVQQGLEIEIAKKIVKRIKDEKMKVQVAIQGDKVRVTGKKRDDLQEVIGFLREANLGLPLQFDNFRD